MLNVTSWILNFPSAFKGAHKGLLRVHGQVPEGRSQKKGYIGSWWFWWSPGWVLVLEGTKPRVANPRVGSGTGFGGPGGGSGGLGGGFFLVVSVMALPLLLLLSRNHRQDHQNHHQDHQNQYQNPLGG